MKGIVDRVIHPLVTFAQPATRWLVSVQDLLDAVTYSELCPVHVTSNDEDHGDRQMVMGNIRQPQGLRLGMEATQEGQNCRTCPLRGAKRVARRIWVLGIYPQFPVKNGAKPAGCGLTDRKLSQPTCCPRDSGIAT